MAERIFIGTYTKGSSQGVYACSFDPDSGALGAPELAAATPNPTYVALSPDGQVLYAVCASDPWVSSFRVGPGPLVPVQQAPADGRPTPCHVAVSPDGKILLAANYHVGQAAIIPAHGDGTTGTPRVLAHQGRGPNPKRQDQPHVHSTWFSPDGRFALICDLGLDRIYTYRIDPAAVTLAPGTPPFVASAPGAGPRHLAFAPDGLHAYVISEMGNTIVAYDYAPANGALAPRGAVSILPAGFRGDSTAAAVRVHPSGRFVYGSARGPDTLAVFAADPRTGDLTAVETVACGGRGPRDFNLSPDGAWLVCAHQDSDTLCSFRVDAASGRLTRVPGSIAVSMPVCVAFAG